MEKKYFIILLGILIFTCLATLAIRFFRAPVARENILADMPLSRGEWNGEVEPVSEAVLELLNPDRLFSASFVNGNGARVQLFVDYYSPENTSGAIHSPRNCLPGSGWIITNSKPRIIITGGRSIKANRFNLSLGESRQVMDFWYITRRGETANDYILKFSTMISSLMLRPTDKAFVRFVTADNPQNVAAMEEFESIFISEIYRKLPF